MFPAPAPSRPPPRPIYATAPPHHPHLAPRRPIISMLWYLRPLVLAGPSRRRRSPTLAAAPPSPPQLWPRAAPASRAAPVFSRRLVYSLHHPLPTPTKPTFLSAPLSAPPDFPTSPPCYSAAAINAASPPPPSTSLTPLPAYSSTMPIPSFAYALRLRSSSISRYNPSHPRFSGHSSPATLRPRFWSTVTTSNPVPLRLSFHIASITPTFTTLCTTRALTPACFCDVSHLLQRRVAASSTRPFDHAVIAPAPTPASSISRRNYQRRGVLWTFYTQRAGRLRRLVPDVHAALAFLATTVASPTTRSICSRHHHRSRRVPHPIAHRDQPSSASPPAFSGLPPMQERPHQPAAQLLRNRRTTRNTTAMRSHDTAPLFAYDPHTPASPIPVAAARRGSASRLSRAVIKPSLASRCQGGYKWLGSDWSRFKPGLAAAWHRFSPAPTRCFPLLSWALCMLSGAHCYDRQESLAQISCFQWKPSYDDNLSWFILRPVRSGSSWFIRLLRNNLNTSSTKTATSSQAQNQV
ncbi:hypothetical protein B0H19DRAFT_1071560 [Mycena capillaripes]|nr:hypothetical protein B0H19DRAFT_1071560 [Mycena capillaripes]